MPTLYPPLSIIQVETTVDQSKMSCKENPSKNISRRSRKNRDHSKTVNDS